MLATFADDTAVLLPHAKYNVVTSRLRSQPGQQKGNQDKRSEKSASDLALHAHGYGQTIINDEPVQVAASLWSQSRRRCRLQEAPLRQIF